MEGSNVTIASTITTLLSAGPSSSTSVLRSSALPPAAPWFPGPDSQYSPVEAVIIALILLCVIIGTVVGNILVCVAVCLVRKLRRPCNYLLVSLAVSDLCVAILVMPMALLYEILGRWSFGPVVCDLWVSFDVLSCTASILNLCMISVDRYYAITKPLEYGVKRTPRRMIACVSLVWLGAACISLPPLLILGNEHGEAAQQCVVCQNFGYQIYATLGSFYIPLTVMIVVYYKIFRAARRIVLEERRAQSHLETHSYLEISVKNGGGPPETRVASTTSSPAVTAAARVQHHRPSTTSTNTTVAAFHQDYVYVRPGTKFNTTCSSSTRCFPTSTAPRRSNESQCPILHQQGGARQSSAIKKTSVSKFIRKKTSQNSSSAPCNNSGGMTLSHHKKLRFALAKERKASTTLGIIMSAFTVCWLPFFVLALVRPFLRDEPSPIPPSLSSLFLWLGYANSLLNPIIYATLNRDFRKPFQQILFFRCGSLNHMMREEFYQSQYGDPEHHYCVINSSQQYQTTREEDAEETPAGAATECVEPDRPTSSASPRADESFL
nr:G-protein coupled receptor 5-HT7R [Periplaneta americana]